jgi:hypothetical protein
MIWAVCQAGEPEPTARFTFGAEMPSCSKKHVRHIRVVVLAGMNQGLDNVLARLERVHHRHHFYEIWTRAYDVKYVHGFSDQRETRLNYSTTTARVREEFGAGGTESAPPL